MEEPALINLNTASAGELERLPGIGPERARAILGGRPYASVDELRRVRGIGNGILEGIRGSVSVD